MSIAVHEYASFRHLVKVFFPITLSLLSGALLLFVDRVFISCYSLESLEACATAASICMFLQVPFMRVTSMTNPMIGNLIGGNQRSEVGTSVWQMIWFALLSSLITLPLGVLAIHFVLQKTFVEVLAIQYLQIILPFNFTFALGVALSSFFIAIGRRWIVVGTTLISHLINIALNYLLIFGNKRRDSPFRDQRGCHWNDYGSTNFLWDSFFSFPKSKALAALSHQTI